MAARGCACRTELSVTSSESQVLLPACKSLANVQLLRGISNHKILLNTGLQRSLWPSVRYTGRKASPCRGWTLQTGISLKHVCIHSLHCKHCCCKALWDAQLLKGALGGRHQAVGFCKCFILCIRFSGIMDCNFRWKITMACETNCCCDFNWVLTEEE